MSKHMNSSPSQASEWSPELSASDLHRSSQVPVPVMNLAGENEVFEACSNAPYLELEKNYELDEYKRAAMQAADSQLAWFESGFRVFGIGGVVWNWGRFVYALGRVVQKQRLLDAEIRISRSKPDQAIILIKF